MNSKLIASTVVAIAALTGASAFAASSSQYSEPAEFSRDVASTSTLTRAQVQAEYLQARKNGTLLVSGEADVNPSKDNVSTLSRAQVQAEYFQARKNGMLPVSGEADVNPSKDSISTLTRAQVKADVLAHGTTQQNKLYSNAM